jgi:hypothetical protein
MSKTTKIIAALGVVAGLGVAALPAFTYAAEVKGNVEIEVDVSSAIAMTITGNNDPAVANYIALSLAEGDTVPAGSYVSDGDGGYEATSDETAQSGETYYQKIEGVNVYTPGETNGAIAGHTGGAAYVVATPQVSGSKTSILPNSIVEGTGTTGTDAAGFGSLVTVYTNNSQYSLTVEDGDATTSLMSGANEIKAVGTDDNALAAGSSAWGFKISGGSSWLAMPANGNAHSLRSNASATTDAATTVLYAVSTSATQATGTYTDTIVYTATAGN